MAGAHHRTQGIEDSELLAETTSAAAPKQSVPQDQNNQCRSTNKQSVPQHQQPQKEAGRKAFTHTHRVS